MRSRAPGHTLGERLLLGKRPGPQGAGWELLAPGPGFWREAPSQGARLESGSVAGVLEVLGRLYELELPDGVAGVVLGRAPGAAAHPVGYGDVLVTLGDDVSAKLASASEEATTQQHGGLVFEAPTSGRFYLSASPETPAFVEVGGIIERGQPVCLLEVMKTFNRIEYGGPGLPARAKVLAVLPDDGADVEAGDPLITLEAL